MELSNEWTYCCNIYDDNGKKRGEVFGRNGYYYEVNEDGKVVEQHYTFDNGASRFTPEKGYQKSFVGENGKKSWKRCSPEEAIRISNAELGLVPPTKKPETKNYDILGGFDKKKPNVILKHRSEPSPITSYQPGDEE